MKFLNKKTLYRFTAMLLIVTMLGANATTLSFTAKADEVAADQTLVQDFAPVADMPMEQDPSYDVELIEGDFEYICNYEEHLHTTENCFQELPVQVCELEETPGHRHEGTCYWYEEKQICGQNESSHVHDLNCYVGLAPACGVPEYSGHRHTRDCLGWMNQLTCFFSHTHEATCYERVWDVACGLQEDVDIDHVHTVECYVGLNPTCGLQEGEGHHHDSSCYAMQETLICKNHVHDENCFQMESKLTCELEEHRHTEECLAPEKDDIRLEDETGAVQLSGTLPVNAALAVTPCEDESILEQIPMKEDDQVQFAYDISILVDGAEHQPDGTVEVTVYPMVAPMMELYSDWVSVVYHIVDGGEPEEVPSRLNDDGSITFSATSFSVYVGTLTLNNNMSDGVVGDYIYFDLAAASVIIENGKYNGAVYKTVDGTTTKVTVTGNHAATNKYYVYQSSSSNRATTGLLADGTFYLPEYDRLEYLEDGKTAQSWDKYITDNTSPTAVHNQWAVAAGRVGLEQTANYIELKDGAATYDVTIDNLWSNKARADKGTVEGGIVFMASTGGKATIHIKGDNRFNNVHYSYNGGSTADEYGYVNGTGIVFENGENGQQAGTLTVVSHSGKSNHYCSVIGGNDDGKKTEEDSRGIVINSGIIYAGARVDGVYDGAYDVDNCSAIGGGGNGRGVVTITGGTVTAVVHTTGAAIGGGIGESDVGGEGYVTIKGTAQVFAYNFGYVTYSGGNPYTVPAAAIGGASSRDSTGSLGRVTISGSAKVYAESVGGAAIGGGSSTKKQGGAAEVTIGGNAEVTAISRPGTVNGQNVNQAGVSIGGGTAGDLSKGNGGNATLLVKDSATLRTGSVGGGAIDKKNNTTGKIGKANITIEGGDISGQFVMAGVGTGNPEDACIFDMSGGTVDNSFIENPTDGRTYYCLYEDGGMLYINDYIGRATLSGDAMIKNCKGRNGGAIYMTAGTFTMSDGTIKGNTATDNGGVVYMGTETLKNGTTVSGTFTMNGGTIGGAMAADANTAVDGGAIYMNGGTMTVNNGTISGNTATNNGGGAYLAGGTLNVSGGSISGNTATSNGGGAYLAGGDLNMSGGTIGDKEAAKANTALNGGGAYLVGGTLNMTGGTISHNIATQYGGGAYLTADGEKKGNFTLNGDSAVVDGNKASNGGGVYLTGGEPNLLNGKLQNNGATKNGGGICIDNQHVQLNPTGTVFVTGNKTGGNGAGIYIGGTAGEDKASFSLNLETTGTVTLTGNEAKGSGGAVCIENGWFKMEQTKAPTNITVTGNKAANGGGVAVLAGNFDMSYGEIGASGAANEATNGGGVYVSGGQALVSGGTIHYNEATNGGGVNVSGGDFKMTGGTVASNVAAENGGGVSVSGGNFRMENGTIGGTAVVQKDEKGNITAIVPSAPNSAKNGGGICVTDGNVTIINGMIEGNTASNNGGGMLVSAQTKEVQVTMLSGSMSRNEAGKNGGGMAVESAGSNPVTVEIGCLLDHHMTNGTYPPFAYTGSYDELAHPIENHETCPVVEANKCANIGGGFYLNSAASTLKFYCIVEAENVAADNKQDCWGMDVEGGAVVIGDPEYHNSTSHGDSVTTARGNVQMNSPVQVNGGRVDVYGDMNNPVFKKPITVAITNSTTSYFKDHRNSEGEYKVHYTENFLEPGATEATGDYKAFQYTGTEAKSVNIESALFVRPGYTILGWNTAADGTGTDFEVNKAIDLTADEYQQFMGKVQIDCETCGKEHTDPHWLVLYAQWERNGFTIQFDPNMPGTTVERMPKLDVTYGDEEVKLTANAYVNPGHIFTGWNTMANGLGTSYDDQALCGMMTDQNNAEIILYAQWKKCDHSTADEITYTADGSILTRSCSCGGYEQRAQLTAPEDNKDGNADGILTYANREYPAAISYLDGPWPEGTAPAISYKKDGSAYSGNPKNAGNYTAFLTASGVQATLDFTVEKAAQSKPPVPSYTQIEEDTLEIIPINDNYAGRIGDGVTKYQVIYKNGTEWVTVPLTKAANETSYQFTAEVPLTTYYVEVWHSATENYTESEKTQGVPFLYIGKARVELDLQQGITGALVFGDGTAKVANLDYDTEQYYLIDDNYDFRIEVKQKADGAVDPTWDNQNLSLGGFSTDKDYHVIIHVSGIQAKLATSVAVTKNQVFGSFTDTAANISRNSSFTVNYMVQNYSVDLYQNLKLEFNLALPENTKIILQNRRDHSYWHYTVEANGESSILLEDNFKRMGGADGFAIAADTTELNLQFIVDFSQSAGASADLTAALTADKISEKALPLNVRTMITVEAPSQFSLVADQEQSMQQTLTMTGAKSYGSEAKWEGREMALVLTPTTTLPRDAQLELRWIADANPTLVSMTPEGAFVIPMGAFTTNYAASPTITLRSSLLPAGTVSYSFNAEWKFAQSKADSAPLNGETVANTDLTFAKASDSTPSLKIEGNKRLLSGAEKLAVQIHHRNMGSGYTFDAEVQKKVDVTNSENEITGWTYQSFGKVLKIESFATTPITWDVEMANASGSYRVIATILHNNIKVEEVCYYFIVE